LCCQGLIARRELGVLYSVPHQRIPADYSGPRMKMGWIDRRQDWRRGYRPRVKHPEHRVYPYLLRGIAVTRPNPVWSTNITYLRLARSFVYRVAIIDRSSRRVLPWRISNSRDPSFCVDCLDEALGVYGKPEIKWGSLCLASSASMSHGYHIFPSRPHQRMKNAPTKGNHARF